MTTKIITPATTLPITVVEAKAHSNILTDVDDTIIAEFIKQATREAENITHKSISPKTYQKTLAEFGNETELLFPPLISITSIHYTDTSGVDRPLSSANYVIDSDSGIYAKILPVWGQSFPATRSISNAVKVVYQAGMVSPSDDIKQFIRLYAAWLYENREATEIPKGIENILTAEKIWEVR